MLSRAIEDNLANCRPERTCVGCRRRAGVANLIRVVVVEGVLVPDPARRLPGRGAHLHPDEHCLALAERRRAWSRAFRIAGPFDSSRLRDAVATYDRAGRPPAPDRAQESGS